MAGETFTYLGSQGYPWNWLMPLFLLFPIIAARRLTQRVPVAFYVALAVGLLVAWLKVPSPYNHNYNLCAFFACLIWVLAKESKIKSGRQQPKSQFSSIYLIMMVPIVLMITSTPGKHKVIQLMEKKMRFTKGDKVEVVDRQGLDITYEDAWSGSGYYWNFDDPNEHGGLVDSHDVYWTGGLTLISGDEVALRISAWSNSKPRYVVNGESPGWVKPARLTSTR